MKQFIPGRDLAREFFHEVAKPILDARFPDLVYSAGFLGYGSDVLGYDDETSTDHMWGPRFYLFLDDAEIACAPAIMAQFARDFPYVFRGYSVHFSAPDPNDGGVRHTELIDAGEVSPLVFIQTPDAFLREYLGLTDLENISAQRWLALSEHRLLALASANFFVDGLGLEARLQAVRRYPLDVARYLIASQWALIGEEQAFVTRAGRRGDELGTRIICARLVERLMRLCFLYLRTYAPYSKWYGTAFNRLPIDGAIASSMRGALEATTVEERERHLVDAQLHVAALHNHCEFVPRVDVQEGTYFSRPILVIQPERIVDAVAAQLAGTPLADAPLVGSMSQIGNFVALSDDPHYQPRIEQLYLPKSDL